MVHACSPPLRGMVALHHEQLASLRAEEQWGNSLVEATSKRARAASPRTVARSSLFEQCQLGGLRRVLIGAAELARCGLLGGPCRTAITETTSAVIRACQTSDWLSHRQRGQQ